MEFKKENFEKNMKNRPHLVILGAGASVAAIPNGDKNGNKTSVMNGFIDKLGMREVLGSVDLKTKSENLEDIYSEMDSRNDCYDVKKMLEKRIHSYFTSFEITDEVTVYDFLLLSLREKDCIATFNWDPLLLQAYQRCHKITKELPDLIFLHGNVSVGTCEKHKVGGLIGNRCKVCGEKLKPIPLLYPVAEKDYSNNPFIKENWSAVRNYMKVAYLVTIFGYSAPKTDYSAIQLLKEGWGNSEDRNLEEIEIIDIRNEDELVLSWEDFIHTHHYDVFDNFFDSTLGKFPRRSCDAKYDQLMNNKFLNGENGFKSNMTFIELETYLRPLLDNETNNVKGYYDIK